MASLRVVQWTTGIVGKTSLRAIIAHPDLELVGVYCYGDSKIGMDAGTIAGVEPVGVEATNSIDEIIRLKPDCVVYMPQWLEIRHIEQILEAGINIVTTARILTGEHYPDNFGERIKSAALKGGVSFYGTGMNPMFIPIIALLPPLRFVGKSKKSASWSLQTVSCMKESVRGKLTVLANP